MTLNVFVQLLGTFSVTVEEQVIKADGFERRSGAELVQLLALSASGILHRDQVIEGLWPGIEPDVAANRLYQAASYARKALGSTGAIVARGSAVELFPDDLVSVDARVIEQTNLRDEDSVTQAVDLCRGELLPANPYAEWTVSPRRRLHLSQLAILHQAQRWETALELDEADEPAHLALIEASLDVHDYAGANHRLQLLVAALDERDMSMSDAALAVRERVQEGVAAGATTTGIRAFLATDVDRCHQLDEQLETIINDCGGTPFRNLANQVWGTFFSTSSAVQAAVACQTIAQVPNNDSFRLSVAIDVGEAEHSDNRWGGWAVDRCATILAATHKGQTLCSSPVAELAQSEPTPNISFHNLGLFELGMSAPTTLYRVGVPGVADRRTPPRSERLGGTAVSASRPLLGREQEFDEVANHLATNQLVTIVGPGGAGKTHLARHIAYALHDEFPAGVWLCRFGKVADRSGAEHELLSAIGGQHHSDTSVVESIVRSLAGRKCLVVFDNCEHLLEPIRHLCQTISAECGDVRIVATSRAPLRIQNEIVYPTWGTTSQRGDRTICPRGIAAWCRY